MGNPLKRGFTLVELLVVIGIVGFLMLISIPLFQRFARGQQLDDAGRTFRTVFNRAQLMAVKERQRVRIIFTKTSLLIYTENDGYGDPVRKAALLPQGITYLYNFGEQKRLTPPDAAPSVEEIAKSPSECGPEFPGTIEFLMDGTIHFGGKFQDQPQPSIMLKDGIREVRLFDPNRVIDKRIPASTITDLVVSRRGDSKKCYIDIYPNTGRVYYAVLEGELGGGDGGDEESTRDE